MSETFALFFISVLLQETTAIRTTMPVFLIDTEHILKDIHVNPNPFHKMASDSFNDMVRSVTQRSDRVMLFVEDYFSVEDVSSRDAKGSPYHHIRQGFIDSKISYIPNVKEPFKSLKKLFTPLDANVFYLNDSMKTFDRNFKYYYIFFQDTGRNETRVEKLRRHDEIIRNAYYSIRHQSSGPIVAFYTGKTNPVPVAAARVDRVSPLQPVISDREPRDLMIVTDGALFRLTGVYSTSRARRAAQAPPVVAKQTVSRRSFSTRMLYSDFELEFNFRYLPREWVLETVSLLEGGEEVGRTAMGVGAPYDVSYSCAEPIHIHNTRDNSLVTVSQYQVEALKLHKLEEDPPEPAEEPPAPEPTEEPTTPEPEEKQKLDPAQEVTEETDTKPDEEQSKPDEEAEGTPKKTRFSNTVNCGPYFGSNILAGLFVTALLLVILFYGIVTLFNCEANGRYDDATQKPLVIVAQL